MQGDRNNGLHDAASLTGAENTKSSLEFESLGSSSPTAKSKHQSCPHLCEKCGTQSKGVAAAAASHDSFFDKSAEGELSDSSSDRPPDDSRNATEDGINARDEHAESEAGTVTLLSGKPAGKREVQQPKIRTTVIAARRLPKPIMINAEGEELHRSE